MVVSEGQKVNHISSGNSFRCATAVRTATPASAREKRDIIIRCRREIISLSMNLQTQKEKNVHKRKAKGKEVRRNEA